MGEWGITRVLSFLDIPVSDNIEIRGCKKGVLQGRVFPELF